MLIHPAGATHSDRFGGSEARLLMVKTQTQAEHDRFPEPQFFDSGPAGAIGVRLHEEVTYSDDVSALALEGLILELTALAHRDRIRRHAGRRWRYSIAAYASVQKSLNTLGGSGESSMRWVRRMPIIRFSGSVYPDVPKPPSQPNRPGVR